jgi:hypothetical protein
MSFQLEESEESCRHSTILKITSLDHIPVRLIIYFASGREEYDALLIA